MRVKWPNTRYQVVGRLVIEMTINVHESHEGDPASRMADILVIKEEIPQVVKIVNVLAANDRLFQEYRLYDLQASV